MELNHQFLFAKVMHRRLFPKINSFIYNVYYLSIPLSKLDELPISYNKWSAISFFDKDHGQCDGSSLEKWARNILANHDVNEADGEIVLICMPRVFGYVFNPVSFWICYDRNQQIRAVLYEVNNTFGERHTYISTNLGNKPILHSDIIAGKKLFHVSPFLKREGHYKFKFSVKNKNFSAFIDFYNAENKKQLVTTLLGTLEAIDRKTMLKAFFLYPLVTFKSIFLIHWQALKLVSKGIKYIAKPQQFSKNFSDTKFIKKV